MKLRFQFRLRTLFVVVTIVAVACGYVASQAKIVRSRQDWLATNIIWPLAPHGDHPTYQADQENSPGFVRRLLGDEPLVYFTMVEPSHAKVNEAHRLFPEATIDEIR